MKRLLAVPISVLALATVTLVSATQLRTDLIVAIDPKSIADVTFNPNPPVQFAVTNGSLFVSTDNVSCISAGCSVTLNYLRATLSDISLTVDVTVGSSSAG